MRRVWSIVFAIIALGVFAGISHGTALAEEVNDAALEERLVSGSPWSGTHDTLRFGLKGDLEIAFKKQGDKLVGEIIKITNVPSNPAGKVSNLKVKKGVVSFQNVAGGDYYLSLNEKGELVGSVYARTSFGQIKSDITLRPSQ